uniref:Pectin methylesterase inhibitor 5 n=1 Tax=Cunninghamia lanceolata TaxID=28977 RepID=A0A6G9W5F8_CUNLA|nr:pectin methylesterase inhibitor 5 [Cunninghamia lanceolata]
MSSTSRGRIPMDSSTVLSRLLIMATILSSTAAINPQCGDFVTSSCKMTPYPDVCVASLCSYSASLKCKKRQPELVKAAVNVSLGNAQNMTAWAVTLSKKSNGLNKKERAALDDCVENFGDTSDQIHQSLGELKHLRPGTFKFQMSNVQTWMSAALTNEDSCLDGFQGVGGDGRVKRLVQGQVQYDSKLISNALALVNWLASTEGYSKIS